MLFRMAVLMTFAAALVVSSVAPAQTEFQTPDPTMRELFRAENILLPGYEQELGRDVYGREWNLAGPDRANFTEFSEEVRNLAETEDGGLAFDMAEGRAVLVWGNGNGTQPLRERVHLWGGDQVVEMRVRQTADGRSTWRMQFRHDGKEEDLRKVARSGLSTDIEEELTGTGWQTLSFDTRLSPYRTVSGIVPDGFILSVESPVENRIEIGSFRITRHLHEGYCRKEIVLPDDRIWRAVAEVGYGAYLYVNGEHIPLETAVFQRPPLDGPANWGHGARSPNGAGSIPVDIAPYLRPGRNCIGIYARQVEDSLQVYLQGRVVMDSGKTIPLQTDASWRTSRTAPADWCRAGFDDSDWQPVETAFWNDGDENPFWNRSKKVAFTAYQDFFMYPWLVESGGMWIGPGYPVYDGRIVIENPNEDEPRLYFLDDEPVAMRVRIPVGMIRRNPKMEWELTGYDPATRAEPVLAQGTVLSYERTGNSLVYNVNAGDLERGVYALGLTLRSADGGIIESRPREPFMVIGHIPMREVEGDSFEDGLDLTLEDEIDFTDPNDPHLWVETSNRERGPEGEVYAADEPTIVRHGDLVYRETQPHRGHSRYAVPSFSYQFKLEHPGDYYLMVLEYPNDGDRWIGVSVASEHDQTTRAGPSIWTGDRYPVTNEMQEVKWLYRPEPGVTTISLVPIQRGKTAAAARLRVYHIENDLPAMRVNPPEGGGRSAGIYTERTSAEAGFWQTLGRYRAPHGYTRGPDGTWASFRPITERVRYFADALDACEQFTRYLRFTGQNMHGMGTMQYRPNNTGFAARLPEWDERVPRDLRETLIRVFGRNGINVIANLSYAGHACLQVEYPWNDGQVALGKDTAIMVGRDGSQPGARDGGRGYGSGWNALHPRIEELAVLAARDVAEKYKDHDNFIGVNWTSYLTGEWLPGFGGMRWGDPFDYSYDDVTLRRFAEATGIEVPGAPDDPERFAKRHAFLTSPEMRERWVAWRCAAVRELYQKITDAVTAVRPDVNVFSALYIDVRHDTAWANSGKPLEQFLREWGYDIRLFFDNPNLWPTRWTHAIFHSAPTGNRPGWPAAIEQTAGEEFIDLYAAAPQRAAVIMHQWNEIPILMPGAAQRPGFYQAEFVGEQTWVHDIYTGRTLTQPNADNARETFTQTLIGSDPAVLQYGFLDVNMIAGHEQELRDFLKVFRALPAGPFEPALETGIATNLAIAEYHDESGYYLRIANPGCWVIRGEVEVTGAEQVFDVATGRAAEVVMEDEEATIPVALDPYGLMAVRITGDAPEVVAWSTEPVAGEERAHLEEIVARAERLLENDAARGKISDDDAEFLQDAIADARGMIEENRIAEAWRTLTYWRFWNLVKLIMEPAAE